MTEDSRDRLLSVQLDIELDRRPVSGRLCSAHGAPEPFTGWLEFIQALQRLHRQRAPASAGEITIERDGRMSSDELINAVTGLRTVFRQRARDTAGALLQVDWIGEPRWTTGPDHIHPRQEERFEVIAGRLGMRVDGVERVCEAGEVVVAPAGAAHAAWNAGEETVHVLVDFRPALATESAFETLAALARDGLTTRSGVPRNPLRAARILLRFQDEYQLARPPWAVQRVLFGPLAALARLLGLPAEYPYFPAVATT